MHFATPHSRVVKYSNHGYWEHSPPPGPFGYVHIRLCPSSGHATLDTSGKRAPAVGSQRTIRRATGVIFGRFKSVLRCRSTSLESTPGFSSSHGLCRNFKASSTNFSLLFKAAYGV